MSYFAAAGSVGFFVAPAIATPAQDRLGVGATALFIFPAMLMGFTLFRSQRRASVQRTPTLHSDGISRPGLFAH
jgi:FSR family fosmidomycin resistance protein-like MFS transporter